MQTTHAITMYHVSILQFEINYVNICLPNNISGLELMKFNINLPIPLFVHHTFMSISLSIIPNTIIQIIG